MGKETKISWADHTGNPWVGCSVAHTGCERCYARDFAQKKHGKVRGPWALWGPGQDRLVTKGFWTDAPKWARAAARDGVKRTIFPSLMDPLDAEVYQRAEAPTGVACRATFDRFMQTIRNTVALVRAWKPRTGDGWYPLRDVVGGEVPASALGYPGLTWLLLTKRPENWRWIPEDVRRFCWLLYSASDQPSLDAGMPHLLAAEGFAGLGLSLEPLVGPVDLSRVSWGRGDWCEPLKRDSYRGGLASNALGWVIIGGESGRNARPCDVAWIRDIVRQCRKAGVAPYVKQMGAFPRSEGAGAGWAYDAFTGRDRHWRWDDQRPDGLHVYAQRNASGADPSEWPEDLRVQEFPEGLRNDPR